MFSRVRQISLEVKTHLGWGGILLLAPFYLNDFGFWALQKSPAPFYLLDYACRLFVLLVAAIGLATRKWDRATFLLGPVTSAQWRTLAIWSVGLSLIGLGIDQGIDRLIGKSLAGTALFKFPSPDTRALKVFDQSFGIVLVALSEELVFRGFLHQKLLKSPLPRWAALLIQTLAFSAMHWGSGGKTLILAWVWCLPPTLCVLFTRNIWPGVIAHFVTDFIAFW